MNIVARTKHLMTGASPSKLMDGSPSKEDVAQCYRSILGRDPESDAAVEGHQRCGSLENVIRALLDSKEYAFLRQRENLLRPKEREPAPIALRKVAFRGSLLVLPEGDWMLDDLVAHGDYEPYVIEPFLKLLQPHMQVLDIGANVGAFTVQAARRAKHVIAVDASPENAKLIAASVVLNGLSNVTIYPVAISNRLEMATFHKEPGSNKVMRPRRITIDTIEGTDVAMAVPIDALLGEPVDVVKIDIEGREHAALAGASKLFDMRPVFITEYSPDFIKDGSGVEGAEYLRLFLDRGYTASILHRDMTIEAASGLDQIHQRWSEYTSRNITHLDLMWKPS